jgi:hypothetical protein
MDGYITCRPVEADQPGCPDFEAASCHGEG